MQKYEKKLRKANFYLNFFAFSTSNVIFIYEKDLELSRFFYIFAKMSISFFKFMFFMKNIIRGEKMTEINPRKFYIESFLRLDTIQVKFDAFGDFV